MIIRFLPEANQELHEALRWHAQQSPGLDDEFMRCIDEALAKIVRNPRMFPIAIQKVRKHLVRRFPYIIYYEINNPEIMILAVFHTKRNPLKWQRRIS